VSVEERVRILVVEDDDRLRQTLGRALRGRGHDVEEVASLRALDAANATDRRLDCAVVDLRLSDGSGLDAVVRLLARWPALRIVVLTGYGSIATTVEAMRLGVVDYLTKPADADQILAALGVSGRACRPAGAGSGAPRSSRPPTRATGADREARETARSPADPGNGGPSLQRVEWEHIQRVLRDCKGNITRAAEQLGVHRRTLQRKLAYRPPPR